MSQYTIMFNKFKPRGVVLMVLASIRLVSGWPAPDPDWDALNTSVGGRLFSAEPLARPCYQVYEGQPVNSDAVKCAEVRENYRNGSYRTSVYPGFIHTYNEICVSNITDQCLLPTQDAVGGSPVPGSCNQGVVSDKYIAVAYAEDIQAALNFSRETGVRLSVKASGHDYVSRSSVKGSLALWTRNLKDMVYHPSFSPNGSALAPVQAVTVGAGVNLAEVYEFADRHNTTFIGGSATTVTAAGGFTLFGGHSPLSPVYGMSADRALEFIVVTGDGIVRTVNAATNQDLFWALRGAGCVSFGVVLQATFRVEPAMPLTLALMQFNTTTITPASVAPFLSLLINNSASWAADGWGGTLSTSSLLLVTPRLDVDAARLSMDAAARYVAAQNGSVVVQRLRSFYELFTTYFTMGDVTGLGTAYFTSLRVIRKALHHSVAGRADLEHTLAALTGAGLTPYMLQTTPASYAYDEADPGQANSVHDAWRDSYWLVGTEVTWAQDASIEERTAAIALLQEVSRNLTALSPDGTMYPNESDPWTEDWAHEYWGEEKYARLLDIKRKYDPDNLLGCWKCVGFEDYQITTDAAYQCMGAFQAA